MHAREKLVIPAFFSLLVVLSSGCVSLDPQALAMANPIIQDFLEDHPNADIKITHFTSSQSENILDQIRAECDNPYIGAKEYYRVNITDPDTDFFAVVWVDWESKQVECAWKIGTEGKETDKPKEDQGCVHHSKSSCFAGHIYWFDSCGAREDKKEYCPKGCQEGAETCWEQGCRSHAEYKCYGDHVFWFDSCGHVEEKKQYCDTGCELGFCRGSEIRTCEQAGGYCVYPSGCTEDARVCPDGTSVGRVAPYCNFAPCPGETQAQATASSSASGGSSSSSSDSSCSQTDAGVTCSASSSSVASTTGYMVEESQDYGCWESDGGKNIYKKGVAEQASTRLEDHCNDDGSLTEKYCTENNQIAAVQVSCPSGYYCSEGACIGGPQPTEAESTSGGTGGSGSVCRDGYSKTGYTCPNGGICCAPTQTQCRSQHRYACYGDHVYWYDSCGNKESKKQACEYGCKDGACKPAPAEEDFCGNSTLHECSVHSECVKSGCSDQVCAHAQEEIVTTCEYRNCYKASEYGLQCGCFDNRCQWSDEPKCAGEGELTSGPVSPEYQFGCCSGLESFYPHPEGFVGAGNLCYDPAKGVPVCMGNATDDEGWYYPDQTLLREGDCAPPCYDSDGGDNKWVKGTMTFNGSVVGDDFCYPAELGELYGSVGESYCVSDGYGTATSVTRECPSGCYDGACLPEGSPSCSLNTTDSLCPEYCDNETDSDC